MPGAVNPKLTWRSSRCPDVLWFIALPSVNLTPMTDRDNPHGLFVVLDGIDDSIVALTYATTPQR